MKIYQVSHVWQQGENAETKTVTTSPNRALVECQEIADYETMGFVCIDVWAEDGSFIQTFSMRVNEFNISEMEQNLCQK